MITAQVVPLSARDSALRTLYKGSATPVQWLYFVGAVPAAGYAVSSSLVSYCVHNVLARAFSIDMCPLQQGTR